MLLKTLAWKAIIWESWCGVILNLCFWRHWHESRPCGSLDVVWFWAYVVEDIGMKGHHMQSGCGVILGLCCWRHWHEIMTSIWKATSWDSLNTIIVIVHQSIIVNSVCIIEIWHTLLYLNTSRKMMKNHTKPYGLSCTVNNLFWPRLWQYAVLNGNLTQYSTSYYSPWELR